MFHEVTNVTLFMLLLKGLKNTGSEEWNSALLNIIPYFALTIISYYQASPY